MIIFRIILLFVNYFKMKKLKILNNYNGYNKFEPKLILFIETLKIIYLHETNLKI